MLILSAIAFVIILVSDLIVSPSPREQLRAVTPRLERLRAAADSCQESLEEERSRIEAADVRFDSLRNRIDYYEDLDPRGVPADSYRAYIETFEEYNRGIPARTAAGDTLKAHWEICRRIVQEHNALVDTVRSLAEEAGLLSDTPRQAADGE